VGASSAEFKAYVMEQLADLPSISTARFFGGVSLHSGPTQFAMIMDGSLYFVVDDTSRPEYEAMGSQCFSYLTKKGRVDVRKYFEVPADLIEDQDRLMGLAKTALKAARSSAKKTSQA
jgi:DNA transformation protein